MAHPLLLGPQIEQSLCSSGQLNGHPLRDLEAEVGELIDLVRVVGQKPHGLYSQVPEDLSAGPVLPQVRRKAQLHIGTSTVSRPCSCRA